jgi:hypothetical protein
LEKRGEDQGRKEEAQYQEEIYLKKKGGRTREEQRKRKEAPSPLPTIKHQIKSKLQFLPRR